MGILKQFFVNFAINRPGMAYNGNFRHFLHLSGRGKLFSAWSKYTIPVKKPFKAIYPLLSIFLARFDCTIWLYIGTKSRTTAAAAMSCTILKYLRYYNDYIDLGQLLKVWDIVKFLSVSFSRLLMNQLM